MKKNGVFFACIGLVILASCGLVDPGEVLSMLSVYAENDLYTALTQGLSISTSSDVRGLTQGPDGIDLNPVDGEHMRKVSFNPNVRGVWFTKKSTEKHVDLSKYATLVFSINYEKLIPLPDTFIVKMKSGSGADEKVAEVDFFDSAVTTVPEPMNGWRRIQIPLAKFTEAQGDLDLAQIETYFELADPAAGTRGSGGEIYLDEIYFTPDAAN